MTLLFNWLGDLFGFLGNWFIECFRIAKNYVTSFWAFAVLCVGVVWAVVTHVVAMINGCIATITGLVTGSWDFHAPSGLATWLAGANTFFPLNEFCQYLATYAVLLTLLTVYRWVKSWIPTDGTT